MASLGFPLSFIRLNGEPLDVSEVFKTTAERTAYLTNGTRYAGMIVYDYEADKHYRLSKNKNSWQELQGSGSSATIDNWASATEYNVGDFVVHKAPDLYGDDGTGIQVLLKAYYPCLYRCKIAHTSSTDFDTDSANWETIDGTNFTSYTQSELESMLGLTPTQIQTLQDLINNATVETNHTWSSSQIYMKLLDTLAQSKAYTDNTLANSTKIEKEVVTALPSVADANPNVMYLIKDTTSTTNDVYLQYMLIGGSFVSLGKTSGQLPIKIYDATKAYAKDDLVLAKVGGSLTYNILRCINTSGVLANTGWVNSDWEITNGSKLKIEANASNTTSDYRLDITQPDGEVFTTDNLHGIDSVQVPSTGMYRVYVKNGNLYCEVDTGATPPPLSIEKGCLIYTVGGTIQYESVEYGV